MPGRRGAKYSAHEREIVLVSYKLAGGPFRTWLAGRAAVLWLKAYRRLAIVRQAIERRRHASR